MAVARDSCNLETGAEFEQTHHLFVRSLDTFERPALMFLVYYLSIFWMSHPLRLLYQAAWPAPKFLHGAG